MIPVPTRRTVIVNRKCVELSSMGIRPLDVTQGDYKNTQLTYSVSQDSFTFWFNFTVTPETCMGITWPEPQTKSEIVY